jgi:hypothetical protein
MSSSRRLGVRRRERAVAQIEIVAARFEINDDIAARHRCPTSLPDIAARQGAATTRHAGVDPRRHKTQAADHQARPQLQTRPAPPAATTDTSAVRR